MNVYNIEQGDDVALGKDEGGCSLQSTLRKVQEAEVHSAVPPVRAARNPGTLSSQKAQQGQKKKRRKARDGDDDSRSSRALQTASKEKCAPSQHHSHEERTDIRL